jgi:hypothetical protein
MAQCASLQALARPATHGSRMSYRAEVMLGLSGLRETWRDLRRGRPVQFREERPTKGFLSADIYTAERTIAIFDSAEEVWPRRATPGRAPMSRSLLVWPAGYKLDRLVRCAAWRQGPPLRSAWVAMMVHADWGVQADPSAWLSMPMELVRQIVACFGMRRSVGASPWPMAATRPWALNAARFQGQLVLPAEDEADEGGLRLAYCDFRREDGRDLDLCAARETPSN